LPGGAAILVVSVLVAVILAIPFVDRSGERTRWGTTAHWAIGVGALLAWIILGVRS
jgi:quinol-cytochrome oxidoreductase complex cytochrome b subunit